MAPCTVIVTYYNEGDKIFKALQSLEKQAVQPDEIIIINDCSIDRRTSEITEELKKDHRYRIVIHEENLGLSGARNTGFTYANNEIVIPLDADDELPVDAIEHISKTFEKFNNADFVFGNYLIRDERNEKEAVFDASIYQDNAGWLDPIKLFQNYKLLGTSPCKKSTWQKAGGYRSEFTNTLQDMDFWIRVLDCGCRGKYIDGTLYEWNRDNAGMNAKVVRSEYLFLKLLNLDAYARFSKNAEGFKNELMKSVKEYMEKLENENTRLTKIITDYETSSSLKIVQRLSSFLSILKR